MSTPPKGTVPPSAAELEALAAFEADLRYLGENEARLAQLALLMQKHLNETEGE
jgi:hypothetical protein